MRSGIASITQSIDAFARFGEILARRDACERCVAVSRAHFAELDSLREIFRDALHAGTSSPCQRIVQLDCTAHLRSNLCDSVAHRTGADHRNRFDLLERRKGHRAEHTSNLGLGLD
jgi:hypothetical protein